jgi:hypothetical protein
MQTQMDRLGKSKSAVLRLPHRNIVRAGVYEFVRSRNATKSKSIGYCATLHPPTLSHLDV